MWVGGGRRFWTAAEKARLVASAFGSEAISVSDVARQAGVSRSQLYRWQREQAAAAALDPTRSDGGCWLPVPGQEGFQLVGFGAATDDALEHVLEVVPHRP